MNENDLLKLLDEFEYDNVLADAELRKSWDAIRAAAIALQQDYLRLATMPMTEKQQDWKTECEITRARLRGERHAYDNGIVWIGEFDPWALIRAAQDMNAQYHGSGTNVVNEERIEAWDRAVRPWSEPGLSECMPNAKHEGQDEM